MRLDMTLAMAYARLVKFSQHWLALVASVWALAALAALIMSEVPWALVCAVVSALLWDSYRRDRQGRKSPDKSTPA